MIVISINNSLGIVINESPLIQIICKVTSTFSLDLGWVAEFKSLAFLRRRMMDQVNTLNCISTKLGNLRLAGLFWQKILHSS